VKSLDSKQLISYNLAMAERKYHCMFREEDGTCAILRQASSLLTHPVDGKPDCRHPRETGEKCSIRKDWLSFPEFEPVPPMGEIE
jgi:hypothetical protein